jgi:hypothetical protein
MVAMPFFLLATFLGVASAAAPFGTAPACSVATRPQMAGVALYGGQQNVSPVLLLGNLSVVVCMSSRALLLRTHAAFRLSEATLVCDNIFLSCKRLYASQIVKHLAWHVQAQTCFNSATRMLKASMTPDTIGPCLRAAFHDCGEPVLPHSTDLDCWLSAGMR